MSICAYARTFPSSAETDRALHRPRLEAPARLRTQECNSAYYLLRHLDPTYEWGRVFDLADPLPINDGNEHGLRASRAFCLPRLLPLALPRGRRPHAVFQWLRRRRAGGIDLPQHRLNSPRRPARCAPQIHRTGSQRHSPHRNGNRLAIPTPLLARLSQWFDLGAPLNGNNAPQSQIVTSSPGTASQFHRWEIMRP